MSTSSRIGYYENDTVTSISCHSDGYISFNGVLLQEHYKDIDKIKKLVQSGNASHLGTKVSNTSFYKGEDEQAIVETLSEYMSHASYHYLFDVQTNKWKVYNDRKVALLSNAINNFSSYVRIEGLEGENFNYAEDDFKWCEVNKEAFSRCWQSWWTENTDFIQSEIDTNNMCIDVYYNEYQKDAAGNLLSDEVHIYIPFKSSLEADELCEAVYGKTINEIKKEFGEKILHSSLEDKIDLAAAKANEQKDHDSKNCLVNSFDYRGEF